MKFGSRKNDGSKKQYLVTRKRMKSMRLLSNWDLIFYKQKIHFLGSLPLYSGGKAIVGHTYRSWRVAFAEREWQTMAHGTCTP